MTVPQTHISRETASKPSRFKFGQLPIYLALLLATVFLAAALFAPLLAPHDPNVVTLTNKLQSANAIHWLGTDHLGRDVLSRLLYGTRMSLGSVVLCILLIVLIAVPLGGAAGYLGGRVDQALMRFCDGMMTFPTVVLALFFDRRFRDRSH